MPSDKINIFDRIKEISHDTGTGNFKVEGAVTGFSAFGDSYSYNDAIFYAITDGTNYEVGSGQYILSGSDNAITRFPFHSSNSDALVPFGIGVKEVFATYPGKFAVFTSSGIGDFNEPRASGLAIWGSNQVLDYDPNLIWDKNNNYLGINQDNPQYSIDIGGGTDAESTIKSSGIIVGDSGVMFSGINDVAGRQTEPFMRNTLSASTGSDAILELSGIVDQNILLTKQIKGAVFAGPASGCIGGCSPDYPTFRYLTSNDLPLLLIQVYDDVPAAIAALTPSATTSGAMAFGGSHLMVCDGNVWRSGEFT